MQTLRQDLRYAVRVLVRSRWLALAALVSLGLGIGANATVFSFVKAILMPPLPVRQPEALVAVYTRDQKGPGFYGTSYPNFEDYSRRNGVFSGLLAQTTTTMSVGNGAQAERITGELVSASYFSVLGVTPARGRGFVAEEDKTPGGHPVVVLGDGLWRRRFAADPDLVGRPITLNGHRLVVVGIAPPGFAGLTVGLVVEAWVPIMMYPQMLPTADLVTTRRALTFDLVARVRPGVTLKQAQEGVSILARQLEQEYPDANKGRSAVVFPLAQVRLGPNQRGTFVLTSLFLMAVVGLVLLIACANVANLLLASAAARRREIALRLALGASRGRLVRQLLTESSVLALLGGALGLLWAPWAARFLWSLRPASSVPIALDLGLDGRALAFTLLLSLGTVLVFGLVPALRASRPDLVEVLKENTASVLSGGRRRFAARNVLVTVQVGMSLVLLVTAGLFMRSLGNAHVIDPGFKVDGIVVASLDLGLNGYSAERAKSFQHDVVERVGGLPGVQAVTLAQAVPLTGSGSGRTVILEGQPLDDGIGVQINVVGLRYFDTLGIPILRGRDFDASDVESRPTVAIVNETMARQLWRGHDALGKRFRFWGQDGYREVVGIARDSKYNTLGEDARPFLYLPLAQNDTPSASLLLRTLGDPRASVAAVRHELHAMDEGLAVFELSTLRDRLARSLWLARMAAWLLGLFGLLGLVLTSVGIYGVISYSVARRTREIGIRMALGSPPADVRRLVLRQGLTLVAAGLALGLLLASMTTRLLGRLLYGVGTLDPLTFVGTAVVLAAVAALANDLPARRATRIDPMNALRCD